MTGSRGEFEPEDGADDPAAAFAALRATVEGLAAGLGREMTTIRRGVEVALTRFEEQDAPADYGADLGRIVQQLGVVSERLQAVEQSPVLRQGAEHYALALERGGAGLVRTAVQGLERQAGDLERIGRQLAGHVAGARVRREQNRWLAGIGGGALVLGVLLTLLVPRVLPFSTAPRVASLVMGEPAWQAGMSLMAFESPASWQRVAAANQLVTTNADAVAACRDAAAKTGKEQKCAIIVPVPGK